jgi:hypothetical protein
MCRRLFPLLILALLISTSGCSSSPTQPSTASFFPASGIVSGWSTTGDLLTFTPQNLFDWVDGQSDSFIAYGFEQVNVRRYQDAQGLKLNIEVWQLDSKNDAYGLFTASRAGTPVAIGNQGDGDPGLRVIFWQSKYYVHVNANQDLPDEVIMGFAKAVAAALPTGGTPPALVTQLPQPDLETGSEIYFHQEISIQSEVWLGGSNILGLGSDTQGVLARYTLNGQPVHLMLMVYPNVQKAASGLKALQGASIISLVVSGQNQTMVGAVFGTIDPPLAQGLLDKGLLEQTIK